MKRLFWVLSAGILWDTAWHASIRKLIIKKYFLREISSKSRNNSSSSFRGYYSVLSTKTSHRMLSKYSSSILNNSTCSNYFENFFHNYSRTYPSNSLQHLQKKCWKVFWEIFVGVSLIISEITAGFTLQIAFQISSGIPPAFL